MLSRRRADPPSALAELLDGALERPVGRILINTNGIEIAQNDPLLAFLEQHRKRIEVYLQFDGFRLETHRAPPRRGPAADQAERRSSGSPRRGSSPH